jgi:ATP-dependent helicase/nuclease subunit A
MLSLDSPQIDPPRLDRPAPAGVGSAAMPAWLGRAPAESPGTRFAAPSHLDEEEAPPAAAPHAPGDPLGRRFRRGTVLHALMQHLPDFAPAARADAARKFLARPGRGLAPAEQAVILDEALALLAEPELAAAFAPGSLAEAPIAGRIGDRVIAGQVDRLAIADRDVLLLDYKTNRPPPATPEEVPASYLRQMAAYRAVLQQTFPGRTVACALVWTYGARLMRLPDGLLESHAPRA